MPAKSPLREVASGRRWLFSFHEAHTCRLACKVHVGGFRPFARKVKLPTPGGVNQGARRGGGRAGFLLESGAGWIYSHCTAVSLSDARFRPPAPAVARILARRGDASEPVSTLNPAQRAAVEHGRGGLDNGPLLVIAGAGSGKTIRSPPASPGWCSTAPTRSHPAADVLAPRGARDGAARGQGAAPGARLRVGAAPAPTAVGRHLPRHRRAAAARVRAAHRARRELHHPRPRRRRGPAGLRAPRPRPGRDATSASRRRPPAWRSTRARSTASADLATVLRERVPVVRAWDGRAAATVRRLRRGQAARSSRSTTTTCCCTGRDDVASRRSRRHRRRASTTCWSTSTRTPTACRPTSCSR